MIATLLLAASFISAAPVKRDPSGPAVDDYVAKPADFEALENAIAGAYKIAPKLFPTGIKSFDVIMQDTSDFYIYSRKKSYPYEKVKVWKQYQVYRLPHRRPQEHEMWGCAGGPPTEMEMEDRRIIAEYSIRCSPWGSFEEAQKRKNSYYRFAPAYLATMIHEYGHQYEDYQARNPTPLMEDTLARAKTAEIAKGVPKEAMIRELFATVAELIGAKQLYPEHFQRMLDDARGPGPKTSDGHREALVLAVSVVESGTPKTVVEKLVPPSDETKRLLNLFRQDDKGRNEAGRALVALGKPAVGGLAGLLEAKESSITRASAASTLWQLRTAAAGAVPALERSLRNDPDLVVKLRAAQALTGISGPSHAQAAEFLRQIAKSRDPKMQDWIREDAKAIMRDARISP